MTWTHIQSGPQVVTAGGTTVTPTCAATAAGNLLTVHLTNSGMGTWTLPAGWVQATDPNGNPARVLNSGNAACEEWYLPPASNPGGITSVLCTSSASANLKAIIDEDHTDVASPVITVSAVGTGIAGTVTTCAATTATAPVAGDLVKCVFHEFFNAATVIAWTVPAGFTLSGSDTASATHHQFAAYQLSAAGGAMTVTGKSSVASTNAHGWTGLVVSYTAAAAATGAGLVGCFMNPAIWGAGTTEAQSVSDWLALTARALTVRSVYYQSVPATTAVTYDLLADAAAGRKVRFNFKPAYQAPYSNADLAQIDTFLSNCKAAGLTAVVSLWAEPYTQQAAGSAGLMAAFPGMWAFYAPTVRQYYPAVVNFGSYAVANRNELSVYPGDKLVDAVAIDYYCAAWKTDGRPSGTAAGTMDKAASLADGHQPAAIPFGLYECGSSSNVNPANGLPYDSRRDSTAYFTYLQTWFAGRLNAGKTNGDIILFNSGTGTTNLNSPVTLATDFRVGLWQSLFDALNGSSGVQPAQPQALASEIDFSVKMNTTLTTTAAAVAAVPAAGQSATFPQLFAELGLVPASPIPPGTAFVLDDPVNGKLDSARLGPGTVWTDVAGLVRTVSATRPMTRVQGPLISYPAGTCQVAWDNADGRFDPENLAGPYLDASGASQIRPMIPFRLRAAWSAATYDLFSGFTDSWSEGPVTYDSGWSEMIMAATDGFKVLAGIVLPPLAIPAGDGELSGARITRILNSAAWFTDHRKIAAGNSAVQATSYGDTALNLLQLTADTEIGELYISGNGTVVFRNRQAVLTDTRSVTAAALFGDLPGTVDTGAINPPNILTANDAYCAATAGTWGTIFASSLLARTAAPPVTPPVSASPNGTALQITSFAGGQAAQVTGGYPCQPGHVFSLSAWFLAAATARTCNIALNWSDAGGNFLSISTVFAVTDGTGAWVQAAGTVTAPAGAYLLNIEDAVNGTVTNEVHYATGHTVTDVTLGTEIAYASLTRADDDTTLANDIQVTRPGGTLQEATDAASVAKYQFPRSYSRTDILLTSDTEALSWAQWVLAVSKTADDRFDTLTVDPLADPPNLFPQVLGREIGDRITVIRRPKNSGTVITRDCFIRGISHAIDATLGTWLTTWTLQDANRYGPFFVLDDPVHGRLDKNSLAY